MTAVKKYLSLIKFSHTIFAMPFAFVGFCLGLHYHKQDKITGDSIYHHKINGSYPSLERILFILFFVILCMVFARSAAMAFNRWLDAKYDALNQRTVVREIPAGIIKPGNALIFTIVNCILFIVACYFINSVCFFLSPVALFIILFYSYTKRFTALCHLVLGLGLSLAPIGAYIAITGKFAVLPIMFSFVVLFWVSGFDIIYALQDEEFDKKYQLHSIPVALGKKNALRFSKFLHLLAATCVIAAGFHGGFTIWYWLGVAVFTGLLIYQHRLVKPNDLSNVNMAFFTTNGIASVVFAVFVIIDLFLN